MTNAKSISTLHQLLDFNTQNYIAGEVALKKKLHDWLHIASSFKLKAVLQKYHEYVEKNIASLEEFIEVEKITVLQNTNKVIHAMIEETEEKISNCSDIEVKDACLLACIQLINHYKISAYGTAAAFANILGLDKSATLFRNAEVNEKQIDDRLSQMAEFEINKRATAPIVLPE